MLTVYPDYYPRFRCAAGACRHTCCEGWEIDIDQETLAVYRRVPGALGRLLEEAVVPEPAPHFRLGPGDRCPFLTDGGLCELILLGGEELLCQICRDHPRFRSFLPGRTEVGLGLCCEAAAALVLSQTEPARFLTEGAEDPEDPDAAALLALRDALLDDARDRRLPVEERMEKLLARCGAEMPPVSWADWADFYLGLERLDDRWTGVLLNLRAQGDLVDITSFREYMAGRITEYEQLLVYFLYRHFLKAYDDGDPAGKAAFAVLSVRFLFTLGALRCRDTGVFTFADQVEYARLYSAELEYSEENMTALFDRLGEDPWKG